MVALLSSFYLKSTLSTKMGKDFVKEQNDQKKYAKEIIDVWLLTFEKSSLI